MKGTCNDSEELFAELDHRVSDGIEVSLLWNRDDDCLSVWACDGRTGETFEFPIEPDRALDAFRHPFAYADRCRRASSAAACAA